MEKLAMYFLFFIIYSFCGWIIETILCSFEERRLVNRGFLIGPICPIYGCGAIIISALLTRYQDDWIVVFCLATILAGGLEYFTSWIMEKMFHARWWDYSKNKFNINGRICLETMVPFGLLGIAIIYILNPFFYNILIKIPQNITNILTIVLIIVLLIDFILSLHVVSKVTQAIKTVSNNDKKDNTNEITERVKELLKNTWRGKRLVDAFPRFETITKKVKKVANGAAEKSKKVVEKGKNAIKRGKEVAEKKIEIRKNKKE